MIHVSILEYVVLNWNQSTDLSCCDSDSLKQCFIEFNIWNNVLNEM